MKSITFFEVLTRNLEFSFLWAGITALIFYIQTLNSHCGGWPFIFFFSLLIFVILAFTNSLLSFLSFIHSQNAPKSVVLIIFSNISPLLFVVLLQFLNFEHGVQFYFFIILIQLLMCLLYRVYRNTYKKIYE